MNHERLKEVVAWFRAHPGHLLQSIWCRPGTEEDRSWCTLRMPPELVAAAELPCGSRFCVAGVAALLYEQQVGREPAPGEERFIPRTAEEFLEIDTECSDNLFAGNLLANVPEPEFVDFLELLADRRYAAAAAYLDALDDRHGLNATNRGRCLLACLRRAEQAKSPPRSRP